MIYRGYRGQGRTGIRVTRGLFATEGEGVYVSLDIGLAQEFAGSDRYLQEMEFTLDNPVVVRKEPLYILHEAEEIEDPVNDSDSDWLKANKIAYHQSMQRGGDWSQAQEVIGRFLTESLKKMGYDGVLVDQGTNDCWAVVFDSRNVKILKEQKRAHLTRETRLARQLARTGEYFCVGFVRRS